MPPCPCTMCVKSNDLIHITDAEDIDSLLKAASQSLYRRVSAGEGTIWKGRPYIFSYRLSKELEQAIKKIGSLKYEARLFEYLCSDRSSNMQAWIENEGRRCTLMLALDLKDEAINPTGRLGWYAVNRRLTEKGILATIWNKLFGS